MPPIRTGPGAPTRRIPRLAAGVLGLMLVLAAAGAPAHAESPLEATWSHARFGLPAGVAGSLSVIGRIESRRVSEALDRLELTGAGPADGSEEPAARVPLAVVLHGCSGIGHEEANLLYLLTLNGIAVAMPDSFARPGREPLCDVADKVAIVDPETYEQRREELLHALRQIRGFSWADQRRLYLVGFSEGGAAAAQYDGEAFARVVIVGWHCHGAGPLMGLKVPEDVPVLAMIVKDDPWYGAFRGRHCGELFGARPDSKSVQFDGRGHTVLSETRLQESQTAKRELISFLRGDRP